MPYFSSSTWKSAPWLAFAPTLPSRCLYHEFQLFAECVLVGPYAVVKLGKNLALHWPPPLNPTYPGKLVKVVQA